MNRLLIGILDVINKLLALLLIVSSTVYGFYGQFGAYALPVDEGPGYRALATVIGFIGGLVLAGIFSGLLAAIVTIAREAAEIRALLAIRPINTALPPAYAAAAVEPGTASAGRTATITTPRQTYPR